MKVSWVSRYRAREVSDYMTKEKLNEMLKTSKEDYKHYKTSHREAYLRDAAQKLYEIMLNYGEYVYGARYTKLSQFTNDFYSAKQRVPIDLIERQRIVAGVWGLHEYAYHGMGEGMTTREYAQQYVDMLYKIEFLLKRTR